MAVSKRNCPFCKKLETYKQYLQCKKKAAAKTKTWGK